MSRLLWLLPQIFMWIVGTLYSGFGKISAYVMVPVGIWTKWKYPWLTWPWDAFINERTGSYYDPWYDDLTHSRHSARTIWAHDKPFWKEFFWRTRNGFSNGARYTWPHCEPTDVVRNKTEHGYFEYNKNHRWQSRMQYAWPLPFTEKWIHFYIGFKLNRQEGSGFTNRMIPIPFRIRDEDY
jgi:hypothetical protein